MITAAGQRGLRQVVGLSVMGVIPVPRWRMKRNTSRTQQRNPDEPTWLAKVPGGFWRWERVTAVGRWVSLTLGALLLVVSGLGVAWSQEVSTEIATAGRAAHIADLFQDAKASAALEDAELNTCWLDRSPSAKRGHRQALQALTDDLHLLQAGDMANAGEASRVNDLVTEHEHYSAGSQEVINLVGAGETRQAHTLDRARVEPLRDALAVDLSGSEEQHHMFAVRSLREATADGGRLRVGTRSRSPWRRCCSAGSRC